MYLTYNGVDYPCKCKPAKTMAYRGLPEDFPFPTEGEIVLCANDGFVLRKDNAIDYLRQAFDGGVLVLTNEPEREVVEEENADYTENRAPSLAERVAALEANSAALEDALCEVDAILCGLNG